ncbi:hypothetical protein L810_8412 [Burkholderia sp. AU4i]|nr:hypothetical protein L810_8412 [Burkholderia sp. AU4i]
MTSGARRARRTRPVRNRRETSVSSDNRWALDPGLHRVGGRRPHRQPGRSRPAATHGSTLA